MAMKNMDRRNYIKSVGAAAVVAAFAGCMGDDEEVSGIPDEYVVSDDDLSADQEIPELEIIVEPPEANPDDYEACSAFADMMSELGLEVEVNSMTWSSVSENVWDGRDWDITFWEMVGRPSRLDPDEFLYDMFHSSRMDDYNYYFWDGEEYEYDGVVEDQRQTPEPDDRAPYVEQCQEVIHDSGPSTFIMYPELVHAWNADEWGGLVDMDGMGVRNPVSMRQMEPLTDDETLVLSYDTEIQNINPFNQSGEVDMIQHRVLWDRLVLPDAEAEPEPALATEINWVDDTTVEVPFEEGHEFHDGTEVLAEDVKFSFEAHDPDGIGYTTTFTGAVGPIESIDIDDDYRVTFNLENPFAPFEMGTLQRIGIVPKDYWEDIWETMDEANPMDYQEEEPLGSGPMEFVHWRRDEEVRLDRYDNHFDPINYESRVTRIIPDTSSMLSELEGGGVDMLGDYGGDPDVLESTVEDNDHLEMEATVSSGFKQFSYNQETAPFHIPEFRQALHQTVPKETIVEDIYRGWGERATNTPVSTVLEQWHNDDLEPYETDTDAAIETLGDAGFVWDEEGNLHMPEDNTEAPQYD